MIEPRPALVPLTFDATGWQPFVPLAGIALPVDIETGAKKTRMHFREDLLFTHRGLSGPAVLQISSFWQPGAPLTVNLLPDMDVADELLIEDKGTIQQESGQHLVAVAAGAPGRRLAGGQRLRSDGPPGRHAGQAAAPLGDTLNRWTIVPDGSEGYRKAEVTLRRRRHPRAVAADA